jgi:hypothetical protein
MTLTDWLILLWVDIVIGFFVFGLPVRRWLFCRRLKKRLKGHPFRLAICLNVGLAASRTNLAQLLANNLRSYGIVVLPINFSVYQEFGRDEALTRLSLLRPDLFVYGWHQLHQVWGWPQHTVHYEYWAPGFDLNDEKSLSSVVSATGIDGPSMISQSTYVILRAVAAVLDSPKFSQPCQYKVDQLFSPFSI